MKRQNNLGADPILKLVLRLAVPTMLAQLVNVLYSIVDRMYIGNIPEIGTIALAGVGVCGPIVTLLSSFACLVGLGGSPIMAMRMGEGNHEEARRVLNNSFLLLLTLSGVLTLGFLLGREQLLMWFGASAATFPYANTYLAIYTAGTFFALMAAGMNSFLICQGYAGLGMATVLVGALMNIILDPIFIYLLHMDVAGAAIATVLSQMASCIFVLLSLRRKSMPVRLGWGGFSWRIMGRILTFGLSPFLIIASDSVLLIVLNTMLQKYGGPGEGDLLVTCATIVQSYMCIITMPLGGLTSGTQPVVSFNYGAGKTDRIKSTVKCITLICLAFTALMMVFTYTLSPLFVRLFTSDGLLAARSLRYIKIFTLGIIPLAVQYALVDQTTAMGHLRLSLFCSLLRKAVFLAATILLPVLIVADAAFFAEPICDILCSMVTVGLFLHFFPRILQEREQALRERT
ncbi:MAG: MATE family efflux transporter [Pseudoflavonifractor sp.]